MTPEQEVTVISYLELHPTASQAEAEAWVLTNWNELEYGNHISKHIHDTSKSVIQNIQ